MKILKQITFALLLLVSFNNYASTACIEDTEYIKNELITKMAEDEHVSSIFINLTVLSFIESAKSEYNLSGEKFDIDYNAVTKGLNTDAKKIKAKFPEFYNLNKKDQEEVLSKTLKISRKVKDVLVCMAAATSAIVTACGYQIGAWIFKKYTACMAMGGLAILAVEFMSEGGNTPAVEGEVSGTNKACLRFAFRINNAAATNLAICVIGGLLTELVSCGTVYGLS